VSRDDRHLALRVGLLVPAVVIVQIAAVSQIPLFGVNPDLIPLLVVSIGMLAGPIAGASAGFGAGLLVDLALGQTLGVSALVLVVIGHLAGRASLIRDPATLLPVALGAAAALAFSLGFSVIQFLLGVDAPVSLELVRQILLTAVIASLVALPFHTFVRRVLVPAIPELDRRGRRRRRPNYGGPGISPLQSA
jgi:rod shape-determining protein MreD